MMKKCLITLSLFAWLGGGAAQAILPPDASVREPQLRRERVEVNVKYEQYIAEQRKIAIQRHKNVKAGLDYPPWKRNPDGTPKPDTEISSRSSRIDETVGSSWLMGLSGLLAIGGLFCLIKRMTRDADKSKVRA